MSYATTKALLAGETDEALAVGIRERIEGKRGDPPLHDDWTWTEAVSRAAAVARTEPVRALLAAAVKRLCAALLERPGQGRGTGEWPAGLLRVVQQVAWLPEEKGMMARYLAGLLLDVAEWPLGAPTAPALGSSTLELFRALRSVSDRPLHDADIQRAIKKLLAGGSTEEADMELGAMVGLMASYGGADAAFRALQPLRELLGERRDRVLYAVDREYAAWTGGASGLARPLLDAFDEFSGIGRPSLTDQQWAGQAAGRLGSDEPAVIARIRRLIEAAPPARKTKAPPFIMTTG